MDTNKRAPGCGALGELQMTDSDSDLDLGPSAQLPVATTEGTQSLLQALDNLQSIRRWLPKEGDALAGVLTGIQPATGPFGPGHMLVIGTQEGQRSMWLTAYLKGQLEGFHAQPGDGIGVRYLGKGTSAKGSIFNRYDIVVRKTRGAA